MNRVGFLGLTLTAMLFSGCGGSGEGLWLLQIQISSDNSDCETTVDHNHADAWLTDDEDDSDWEEEATSTRSDALTVAEISMTDRSNGVLFIGDNAYPGTFMKGEWEFSWTGTQDTDSSSSFDPADYVSESTTSYSASKVIKMTISGNTAEGSFKSESTSSASYVESDEWDVDSCLSCGGEIPFGQYLTTEQESGLGKKSSVMEVPASNTFSDDCSGSDCELTVDLVCPETTQSFSAMFLSAGADAADALMESGQDFGSVD